MIEPMHATSVVPYTLVQLREVEDDAVAAGVAETPDARFARTALACERVGLSLQRVNPGARTPFAHRHAIDEEIYVVVAGSGRAHAEGELVEFQPFSALRVSPRSARSFEAAADGLEFPALGTHTPEDRGEFVDADWPRSR